MCSHVYALQSDNTLYWPTQPSKFLALLLLICIFMLFVQFSPFSVSLFVFSLRWCLVFYLGIAVSLFYPHSSLFSLVFVEFVVKRASNPNLRTSKRVIQKAAEASRVDVKGATSVPSVLHFVSI